MGKIVDRGNFAKRQAQMTQNWIDGVRRREGDVQGYIEKRLSAYLERWKEAGRFIPDNSVVLDIGGGNLYPNLLSYFQSKKLEYHYQDIDPAAFENSSSLGLKYGFNYSNFSLGFNDELNYEDGKFDCIFSSHCIEHSIALSKTLSALNRILKIGGKLLMSVPFGWEDNPEHPYFISPDYWLTLLEDYGFSIRLASISKEYVEVGFDYFVVAEKISDPNQLKRIDPTILMKERYSFFSYDHPSLTYKGKAMVSNDKSTMILQGNWSIEINSPLAQSSLILPIFLRHNWSGKIRITSHDALSYEDLYSWFPYAQPCFHYLSANSEPWVRIESVGKNESSFSNQAVLCGYMVGTSGLDNLDASEHYGLD